MNVEYVEKHKIFETIIGSRAYGTFNEESDYDKAGVMIPDISYFYGLDRVEQFSDFPTDKTIYEIRKIIALITDNNPNCLDLLYAPSHCIIYNTPYWERIMAEASLFLSKKCKFTYMGYAISQLHRIKTHRKYLQNPPKIKPERKDYNLKEFSMFESAQLKAVLNVESLVTYILDEKRGIFLDELDTVYADNVIPIFRKYLNPDRKEIALAYIQEALRTQLKTFCYVGSKNYLKDEFVEEAENELKYQNALVEWKNYEDWKKHRNKKRATQEEKIGYDGKHASHLIRLCRTGKEILETGKVNVDRTSIDAEELKFIRDGGWSFDKVEEYAINSEKELNILYENSTLQKHPQRDKINKLIINTIDYYLTS